MIEWWDKRRSFRQAWWWVLMMMMISWGVAVVITNNNSNNNNNNKQLQHDCEHGVGLVYYWSIFPSPNTHSLTGHPNSGSCPHPQQLIIALLVSYLLHWVWGGAKKKRKVVAWTIIALCAGLIGKLGLPLKSVCYLCWLLFEGELLMFEWDSSFFFWGLNLLLL